MEVFSFHIVPNTANLSCGTFKSSIPEDAALQWAYKYFRDETDCPRQSCKLTARKAGSRKIYDVVVERYKNGFTIRRLD